MRKILSFLLILLTVLLLPSCGRGTDASDVQADSLQPDTAAMHLLQGIWLDAETESATMMVRGDSIFYPDTLTLPVRFSIIGDSLVLYGDEVERYKIQKQGKYNFSILGETGESIHMVLSQEPADSMQFVHRMAKPIVYNQVTNRDTVVYLGQTKYHCYVTVNPTTKKVYLDNLSDEGISVDSYYYDNVIHISVYQGAERLFSRDFQKTMFSAIIPKNYLQHATLSDIRFRYIDEKGCHFDATICIPDGALCYMVELLIHFNGKVDYKLMDY